MLIDWFTVIAQIVNFIILLLLLKRFLFRPILRAIEQREEQIRSRIEDAETKLSSAEEIKQEFQQKKDSLQEKEKELLEDAAEKAHAQRKTLLENARKDAEALRRQLEQSIREKQQNLGREITQRTQQEVLAIARKVMQDLASADLEEQIVGLFLRRLQQLEAPQREELQQLLQRSASDLRIKSAFELSTGQQDDIKAGIAKIAGKPAPCRFELTPDRISGIELTVQGYKIAWSVADYLSSLEKQLEALLDEEVAQQKNLKTKADEISV